MNATIQKIAGLLPDLEERGIVYLFAVVERDDINLLDVIVSSEWSDKDESVAVHFVADALAARLEPQEMLMLSRVVILPSGGETTFLELPEGMESVSPKDGKIIDGGEFLGLEVKRVFVFKSRLSPRVSPSGESARAIEFA